MKGLHTALAQLCIFFLCLGAPLAVLAQEAQPTQPIVRDVQVTGYQHVTPDVQQQVTDIVTPLKGQPFDQAKVNAAVESIEGLGPFFSARATQEPVTDGVRVIFTVVENPVIDAIRFVGNTVYTDSQLLAVIKTRPGMVLNQKQTTQDALAIRKWYSDHGYTLTEVIDVRIERDEATGKTALVFEIFEPKISDIVIKGNARTRDYVIRRQFDRDFQAGKVYNYRAVASTLSNLNQLGIFQDVTATLEPGVTVGSVRVNLNVVERRTGTAGFGVAQNNVEGWTGFVNLADTNLFGTGQSLSLSVRFGAEDSYLLSYTNPWIDKKRTSMSVNLYNRTILREAFDGNTDQSFDYDEVRKGGTVTFGRPVSNDLKTRVFLGFRADDIKATEVDNDTVPESLLEPAQVRSVSLTATRDTRFPYLKPYQGHYSSLSAEYAGLGGVNFSKLFGEERRFFTVRKDKKVQEGKTPKNWVYATRLMAGTSTGIPPFLDQYFVGGANSMRGYKEDRFPGENMLLSNNELRIPISDALDVVGFVDAGDAWGGPFAEQFGNENFTFHYSYGLGIRLQTPIGPLRLDYGLNDEGGSELTFGVGSTF